MIGCRYIVNFVHEFTAALLLLANNILFNNSRGYSSYNNKFNYIRLYYSLFNEMFTYKNNNQDFIRETFLFHIFKLALQECEM